jgi:hypothetical protein
MSAAIAAIPHSRELESTFLSSMYEHVHSVIGFFFLTRLEQELKTASSAVKHASHNNKHAIY